MFLLVNAYSQKREYKYNVALSTNVSSASSLPFWMVSNKNGSVPDSNSSLFQLELKSDFVKKRAIDFSYGINFHASQASKVKYNGDKLDFFLSELYVSSTWKIFSASLGMKNPEEKYSGVSYTNGNLLMSGNARSYPELVLGIPNYLNVNSWFAFKGVFANGILLDDRCIDNTNVHHKNLFIRLGKTEGFSFEIGVDHYAQWGGDSELYGNLNSLNNLKAAIFVGSGDVMINKSGQENTNDQYNKGGNHLGQNTFKFNYKHKDVDVSLVFRNIYEDKSGMLIRVNRVKDWSANLYVDFKKGKAIQSVAYEFLTTFNQGGFSIRPEHKREPVIGFDNYFGNYLYRSGWTNHGKVIGLPFITPKYDVNGQVVGIKNNAIVVHHIGIAGEILNVKYRFKASFVDNNGLLSIKKIGDGNTQENYKKAYSYSNPLKQQSYCLDIEVPKIKKLPFDISASIALDKGQYLKDNIGFNLKLTRNGIF